MTPPPAHPLVNIFMRSQGLCLPQRKAFSSCPSSYKSSGWLTDCRPEQQIILAGRLVWSGGGTDSDVTCKLSRMYVSMRAVVCGFLSQPSCTFVAPTSRRGSVCLCHWKSGGVFSSRAGSDCFGVIRGVCSILPEGSAAWRIKSPTCLCFADLCCPGNRCRDFPFLHFFFLSLHYPYHSPPTLPTPPLHSTHTLLLLLCFLPHDLPHSMITQTHTHRHTLCTHNLLQSFHNVTGQSN